MSSDFNQKLFRLRHTKNNATMASKLATRDPIQLRRDHDSDEDLAISSQASQSEGESPAEDDSDDSASGSESSEDDIELPDKDVSGDDEEALSDEEDGQSEPEEALQEISFGTLAEAQEKYAPKSRKRKLPGAFDRNDAPSEHERSYGLPKREEYQTHAPKQHRQSKHAPTILSSRQQVSRKREVFDPSPADKSRDPRFDPTIMSTTYSNSSVDRANRNYAFLTSYQAAEILDLKSQIKKTKDPNAVAELKRKVMSVESKIRSAEARQRESKILKEHNQKEREAIRAGQKAKPYYLKPGEVKKKAEEERVAGMGKRARDKAEQRKKKREKSKEARFMPRFRREG